TWPRNRPPTKRPNGSSSCSSSIRSDGAAARGQTARVFSSWPGLTRLRGRSRFGEAKARPSTSFLRVGLLVHLREDRARHQASAGPGLSRRRTASKSRATLATSGPRAAPAARPRKGERHAAVTSFAEWVEPSDPRRDQIEPRTRGTRQTGVTDSTDFNRCRDSHGHGYRIIFD